LITHAKTHLSVATIGVFIAFITLVTSGKHIMEIIRRVDYKTLLFFVGLFIVVGGLEQTGILELIAQLIEKTAAGNPYVLIAIIIWVSAIASAFIDNIPFAATMIPVIQSLAVTTGLPLATMSWALSIGTDIGGSATPIGASANVVGTSVSAKSGYSISWARYCKVSGPATVMVILISTIYIWIVYL
jgi:Na+/H+ antiporter NhaD/arsenite permease-like protein